MGELIPNWDKLDNPTDRIEALHDALEAFADLLSGQHAALDASVTALETKLNEAVAMHQAQTEGAKAVGEPAPAPTPGSGPPFKF